MTGRERKERQIRGERERIARLERELENARRRLGELESDTVSTAGSVPPASPTAPSDSSVPTSPGAKLALFRSLFRGRTDVFPTHWTSAKTGKQGYAPACSNEWRPGLCEKPRVKCGECPHQAFSAVTDEAILGHLQGRHVMGVYPLLADESCWFVAADFDKDGWTEDVAAFRETCVALELPVAVERSRSGNGAHAWFFFASPVSAANARKLACLVLTETMARRHELSMSSYDRLFPNQDTMPKGGFGNLIALPLQHAPRKNGNTVFLDDDLMPIADQWGFLSSLERISGGELQEHVARATRSDRVLAVPRQATETDGESKPWARRQPGSRSERLPGPLPDGVRAVLANGIFVESAGLPPALLSHIKRLAAFQNPEFYKKQAMRFSTALTPRVISCAESHPQHVRLPRGCLHGLRQLLESNDVQLVLTDEREIGESLDLAFAGDLTESQQAAVEALLRHDIGILSAPPGVGKTVMGAALIAMRGRSTLVIVHRKPLLEQWVAQLALFLDRAPETIGQIGGGKRRPTGSVDVAMLQSLVRKSDVAELVGNYGHVVMDECHHVAAVSFERVLGEVRARHVTGLTATPYRRDGHQPIITMQCGPVRHVIGERDAALSDDVRRHLIIRETSLVVEQVEQDLGIQSVYASLAGDDERNEMIIDDVIAALEQGRSPLVLTERREHLDLLAARLQSFCRHLVVLHGGLKPRARRETMAVLATVPDSDERLILATGRYIGEGFDDARLDTLFLTMPVPWKGTLVQYAGRLHRAHPTKTEVRIHDYHDAGVPVLSRMFQRRLARFKALGYAPCAAAPAPRERELRIELD